MNKEQLQSIPADDLLKIIGELFLQVRLANSEIAQLHEHIKALETKNKEVKNDRRSD